MALFPQPTPGGPRPGHMIVCGDDALAERLAAELTTVYRERVTLVVPTMDGTGAVSPTRASVLFGRVQAAMNRAADAPGGSGAAPRILEAPLLTEPVLVEAGVRQAAALAPVHDDDATNIHAATWATSYGPVTGWSSPLPGRAWPSVDTYP